ncbi:hypothetical protein ACFLX9_03045 [Chloroflexota bacterium]
MVEEADFPPGVWNVVHGAAEAAEARIDHPDVAEIALSSVPLLWGGRYAVRESWVLRVSLPQQESR